MHPFLSMSDTSPLRDESTRALEVPVASNKDALLLWFADALELPEYFGHNWDAFEECLRDLSWLRERRVLLHHRAIPLGASPVDRRVYLDVLAAAVQDWKVGEAHEIVVSFDPACEAELRAAISFSSSPSPGG